MYFDQQQHIPAPGGQIWTAIKHGADQHPPLVLVHGGPGSNHLYLSNFSEHLKDRTLIYYDQLDSGYSARPHDPAHWTLERACAELAAVIEFHALERFHLLGSSWGGSIATAYASTRDQRLASLVLAGPLINGADWNADNHQHLQRLPSPWREVLLAGDSRHPQFAAALQVFNRRHMLRLDEEPAFITESDRLHNPQLFRHMWGVADFFGDGTLAQLDLVPLLPRILCPAYFVVGEHDECTPGSMHRYVRHLKQGSGHVVPDASHLAHVEQPGLFFGWLAKVLARHDAPVREAPDQSRTPLSTS
ncbi:proline iminopeptidase-family hydrolase [Pseudomonas sp. MSSRFD41]|uniref:proline iminopeptidase-family hydrolase n=1 Tax=Pseudomonas sp. MSSRFD41 TaxID=1310370 RepID=UPI001639EBDD|nr:proline iminopeptidase-family hydrolase [Pseudomonas sp. MSSRFD41]MBC2656982.1 proline iminopeptidase-family hydrolase [Pseudomonas sp. MSSRFD41]